MTLQSGEASTSRLSGQWRSWAPTGPGEWRRGAPPQASQVRKTILHQDTLAFNPHRCITEHTVKGGEGSPVRYPEGWQAGRGVQRQAAASLQLQWDGRPSCSPGQFSEPHLRTRLASLPPGAFATTCLAEGDSVTQTGQDSGLACSPPRNKTSSYYRDLEDKRQI